MTSWVDGIMIVLLAFGVLAGFRHGLIRGTMRLASFFLSLWLGWKWTPALSKSLANQFGLREWMENRMKDFLAIPLSAGSLSNPDSLNMDKIARMLDMYQLPAWQKQLILSQVQEQLHAFPGNANGGTILLESLINLALYSIAFFMIIAGIQLVSETVGKFVHLTIGRLPLVWVMDRIGGAVLGFAQQFLFLSTAIGLLVPVMRLWPGAGEDMLKGSILVPHMLAFFNSVALVLLRMAAGA